MSRKKRKTRVFRKIHTRQAIFFLLAFIAAGGFILLALTNAATDIAVLEPESGNITLPASRVNSPNASGGQYVEFGTDGAYLGAVIKPCTGINHAVCDSTLQGQKNAVLAFEDMIGRKLALYREFYQWDQNNIPSEMDIWAAEGGRVPVININTKKKDGTVIPWLEIANGLHDARIRSWADQFKTATGGKAILLILAHEPEDGLEYGTPADYKAAWRQFVKIFREQDANNVSFVWSMTPFTFREGGPADSFYPGDDIVDWVAVNPFNASHLASGRWRQLSETMENVLNWNSIHNKKVMISASGSIEHPTDPDAKAVYFQNAATLLKSNPEIKIYMYYHSDCCVTDPVPDYWVDSSPQSLAAFKALASDPYFNTTLRVAVPLR